MAQRRAREDRNRPATAQQCVLLPLLERAREPPLTRVPSPARSRPDDQAQVDRPEPQGGPLRRAHRRRAQQAVGGGRQRGRRRPSPARRRQPAQEGPQGPLLVQVAQGASPRRAVRRRRRVRLHPRRQLPVLDPAPRGPAADRRGRLAVPRRRVPDCRLALHQGQAVRPSFRSLCLLVEPSLTPLDHRSQGPSQDRAQVDHRHRLGRHPPQQGRHPPDLAGLPARPPLAAPAQAPLGRAARLGRAHARRDARGALGDPPAGRHGGRGVDQGDARGARVRAGRRRARVCPDRLGRVEAAQGASPSLPLFVLFFPLELTLSLTLAAHSPRHGPARDVDLPPPLAEQPELYVDPSSPRSLGPLFSS